MIKLFMARHGETGLNTKKVYYGWLDPSLNENGIKQCEKLQEKLSHEHFDIVVTTPLNRTKASAEIISPSHRDRLIMFEELKEINFGKWEGLHYSEIEKSFVKEWGDFTLNWQNFCFPKGESFSMLYERVQKCLEKIINDYEDRTILLVAHEGTLKIITTILLGMKPQDYWKFNFEFGCYSLLEIQKDVTILRKVNC